MDKETWRARYQQGLKPGHPRSCPSVSEGLSLEDAYALLLALPSDGNALLGFKGALTNAASQASFGLQTPALGLLLTSMELDEVIIDSSWFSRGAIETEIGLTLQESVTHSPKVEDLSRLIAECFFMVELIDTHFESTPTAADLVMNNSAAKHYLKGPQIPLSAVKAASLQFLKDDESLLSEAEEDWLSSHMETLSWMIDQALSLGFSLTADHVWMTGAMGPIHPLKPGRYQYTLGGESSLTFSVT